jgi:hypothetical protein
MQEFQQHLSKFDSVPYGSSLMRSKAAHLCLIHAMIKTSTAGQHFRHNLQKIPSLTIRNKYFAYGKGRYAHKMILMLF